MSSVTEINLAGRIVEQLMEVHSWCGETHIQKCVYVAKTVRQVPFESEFILYKHGPYSFDLNGLLNQLRSEKILVATPQGGYGSTYSLNTALWGAFRRASQQAFERYDESIRFVCEKLGRLKVVELERVATAVYVISNFDIPVKDRPEKLIELKPHIKHADAVLAFHQASEFWKKP